MPNDILTFATAGTPPARLEAFFARLHPVTTEHALIRLGPDGDGGYLVPDDLKGITACFSPGVGTITGFEHDCAERGMNVYLADNSVDAPTVAHPNFHFTQKHISSTTSAKKMTLNSWVNNAQAAPGDDLMLQFDIEGDEYEMFLNASIKTLRRFRVIVGEFHMLDAFHSKPYFRLASRAFTKILRSHVCVHIHPNNVRTPVEVNGLAIPPLAEFTFLRKDRCAPNGYAKTFPHPLDQANTDKPDFALPKSLYRS